MNKYVKSILIITLIFFVAFVIHSIILTNITNTYRKYPLLTSISDDENYEIDFHYKNENEICVLIYKLYDIKNKVGETDVGKKHYFNKTISIEKYKEILSNVNDIKGDYYNLDDDSIPLIRNVSVTLDSDDLDNLIYIIKKEK